MNAFYGAGDLGGRCAILSCKLTKRLPCGEVVFDQKPTTAQRKEPLHEKGIPNPGTRQGERRGSRVILLMHDVIERLSMNWRITLCFLGRTFDVTPQYRSEPTPVN